MTALIVAGILIMLVTSLMLFVEGIESMRDRARATRRAEREEVREEIRRREWDRIEADAVEDLRMNLDTYGITGFLWLDEQKRREEG